MAGKGLRWGRGGGDMSAFRAWGVHMGLLEAFRGGEAVMWWECSK